MFTKSQNLLFVSIENHIFSKETSWVAMLDLESTAVCIKSKREITNSTRGVCFRKNIYAHVYIGETLDTFTSTYFGLRACITFWPFAVEDN